MKPATSRCKMMTTTVWACVFAVLCATFVKASRQNMAIDIEPKRETAVRVGESLQILCKAPQPLRVCRVEIPGEGSMVLSERDGPSEDGIEYYGDGVKTGQCGVRITKVKETHDGIFKCSLTSNIARQEATASLKIIVARPPNNPDLRTSPGSVDKTTYRKGEKLEISCSAPSGRPAANISLFIDDEPIGTDDKTILYETIDDNSLAMQNASRSLDWTDNGKTLRCVASHIALDRPKETTMQLDIYYPPQPHATFERFGYVIGRQGIINVTIFANPRPRFTWRVNQERIDEGRPDESNRLETSTAVELGKGAWSVILTIDSVQKSDTEKEYLLIANNNEGSYEYRIVLSTSSEPAGAFGHFYGKLSEHMHALGVDLDAGSIIGIVVGVLVLVLIIFLVIFARATGRWCFAGHSSTRNLGESDFADPATSVSLLRLEKSKTTADVVRKRSDTESAGRYSRSEVDGASRGQRKPRINLSRLFGRNKDKVSGTDTDTMKTVVTVDDEKVAEPVAQESRTNPATGEGGIVYAELDLTQQGATSRRLNEDKTEYAEILYTKPETEETADK